MYYNITVVLKPKILFFDSINTSNFVLCECMINGLCCKHKNKEENRNFYIDYTPMVYIGYSVKNFSIVSGSVTRVNNEHYMKTTKH